jgi:glycine cleavage system H lipoate-binding protein
VNGLQYKDRYAYIGITMLAKEELKEIECIEIHRLGEKLDAD